VRFKVNWSIKTTENNGSSQIKLTLTQEEIAEVIGTTRETVTRLFAEFKKSSCCRYKVRRW